MSKRSLPAVVVMMMMGLAGCCPCMEKPVGPLPAPLSPEAQLNVLNARARALSQLTMAGTVVIRYADKGGEDKRTVDGRLLIRQHYGKEAVGGFGDVFLAGKAFDQEVFRAGNNREKWWFVAWKDKTAWVGDVAGKEDSAAMEGTGVLRADTVLQVLGITEIVPREGETVAMMVRDDLRSNDVLIVKSRAGGGAGTGWVKREIVVDRDSGEVRAVSLYDAAGVLVVKSDLKDYRPVTYREGDQAPAAFVPVKFPYDIWITYPAKKASIHLTISGDEGKRAELREALPGPAFELPDLTELKVVEDAK